MQKYVRVIHKMSTRSQYLMPWKSPMLRNAALLYSSNNLADLVKF